MNKLLISAALIVGAACFAGSYADDFSSDTWGKFEEPINACYSTDAGSVYTTDAGVLAVEGNSAQVPYSNHIIAQHRISDAGVAGTVTLDMDFYIDADANNWLSYPQTGPEISVQNTRLNAIGYKTQTMALQYVTNPWNPGWNIWSGYNGGGSASWVSFSGPSITPRTWYHVELIASMDYGEYVSGVITPDGGSPITLPIEDIQIAQEAKWSEEALWVTAETENLWANACGGGGDYVLSSRVLYDNVVVGW